MYEQVSSGMRSARRLSLLVRHTRRIMYEIFTLLIGLLYESPRY